MRNIRGIFIGVTSFGIFIIFLKIWLGLFGEEITKNPLNNFQNLDIQHELILNSEFRDTLQKMSEYNDEEVSEDDPRRKLHRKIVHLDMKGMPPKMSYLTKLFPLFKKMGVTGLLIEYEDMFPYYGPLAVIANKEAYTRKEIASLNMIAAENDLEVIPLVQTFGHLEFALKIEQHVSLREVPRYSQVLCPSNNRSMELVKNMIDQVLSLHPQVTHLHIGSDEVYYIGVCDRCVSRASEMRGDLKVGLFLSHVKSVVQHVIQSHKKRVMMWDDEFRKLDEDTIKKSGLGSLVDIVVWNYSSDVDSFILDSSIWEKYSRTFPSIWIGSAFKGADRPDSIVANEALYLSNHYAWIRTLRNQASSVNVQGIILTGWSRYDHFSILCEILGVAIPSLMCCLTYLNNKKELGIVKVFEITSTELGCMSHLYQCSYPGSSLYEEITRLKRFQGDLENLKNQSSYKGWANAFNLKRGFSNLALLDGILSEVGRLNLELGALNVSLERSLNAIYPAWAVSEWMQTHFVPIATEIEYLYNSLLKISNKSVFPVRPVMSNSSTEL